MRSGYVKDLAAADAGMPTFKYIRPFHPKIKQIKEQSSKPSLQVTPLVNLRLRARFVLRLAA